MNVLYFMSLHMEIRFRFLEILFTFFDIGSTKEKQFGFTSVMENGLRVSFPGDEPYRESLL